MEQRRLWRLRVPWREGFAFLLLVLVLVYLLSQSAVRPGLAPDEGEQKEPVDDPVFEKLVGERRSAYNLDVNVTTPVTAILLHWKRQHGLEKVVRWISGYPFVREIIIWSNGVMGDETGSGHGPTFDQFVLDHPGNDPLASKAILRIVPSPANTHDLAKHLACSMASYSVCYFQDDDWLNIYMDSGYTAFRLDPDRIHSNTMPIIHLEHHRWNFYSKLAEMETRFTWLGTGSFVPRHFSQRFLRQLGHQATLVPAEKYWKSSESTGAEDHFWDPAHSYQDSGARPLFAPLDAPRSHDGAMPASQLLLADMYFSLWTNSQPVQMSNTLRALWQGDGWSTGQGVDQWKVVYGNILDAVRRLYDARMQALIQGPESALAQLFPPADSPASESEVRAPCFNDKCLFISSSSAFPSARSLVPYPLAPKGSDDFSPHYIDHILEHEALFNDRQDWPSNAFWDRHAYHLAVDGDKTTCWDSFRAMSIDDYFGVQMVTPLRLERLGISGSGSSFSSQDWVVQGSLNGILLPLNALLVKSDSKDGLYEIEYQVDGQIIDRILIRSKRKMTDPIQVCWIKLNDMTV